MNSNEVLTGAFRQSALSNADNPPTGTGGHDPYEILDDLMCVIEELCPRWPSRPVWPEDMTLLL